MEKEQKKLLLVAVSVGVFLLVTITVAIIILTSKIQTDETAFSSSTPYSQGRSRPAAEIAGGVPPQPVFSNSREANIDKDDKTPDTAAVDSNNGDSLTIQIPKLSTAGVPDNTETPPAAIAVPSAPATPATAAAPAPVSAPAPAARPAAPSARPSAAPARPAPAAASSTAAPSRTINDFWIQAGAYSSLVRAEDVKEILASKGLTSIIETRIVGGQNLYRVRLGPYTSEREANYWLALVKSVEGFNESQVRQTTRQR